MCVHSPHVLRPSCFTPFCFNALYQFTGLLDLHPLLFGLMPLDRLHSTKATPYFWEEYHFCFMLTISYIQLGVKQELGVCTLWSCGMWMSCCSVYTYWHFGGTECLHLQGKGFPVKWQQAPPKLWYPSTKQNDITTHKTVPDIAVKEVIICGGNTVTKMGLILHILQSFMSYISIQEREKWFSTWCSYCSLLCTGVWRPADIDEYFWS